MKKIILPTISEKCIRWIKNTHQEDIHGTINNRGIMEINHRLVIHNLMNMSGLLKVENTVKYTFNKVQTRRDKGEIKRALLRRFKNYK